MIPAAEDIVPWWPFIARRFRRINVVNRAALDAALRKAEALDSESLSWRPRTFLDPRDLQSRKPGNPERCEGMLPDGTTPAAGHDEDCDPCTVV